MKLSFSTRGWSDRSWDEIVELACEQDFQGIEVYNAHTRADLMGKGGPLHKYGVQATARALRDRGIEMPILSTSLDVSAFDCADAVKSLIAIASRMSASYVSVVALSDDEGKVRENLDAVISYAEECGIVVLVETVGIYADTARLTALMDEYASDHIGALWEICAPYRLKGEKAAITIKNLGAYVKHVHMHDSAADGSFNLVGEGTFPINDIVRALSSINYDGFVSLEWEPEWMEDLTDPEIIFPHYVNFMERFGDTRASKRKFLPNHDGSGEYLWSKDESLDLTFPQVLDAMVDAFPNQYAFRYTTLDYTRTYEEFREDVDNFARALVSMGVRPGSKVAIWATNVPAWYITFWATTKIGAVLVTVNTASRSTKPSTCSANPTPTPSS